MDGRYCGACVAVGSERGDGESRPDGGLRIVLSRTVPHSPYCAFCTLVSNRGGRWNKPVKFIPIFFGFLPAKLPRAGARGNSQF